MQKYMMYITIENIREPQDPLEDLPALKIVFQSKKYRRVAGIERLIKEILDLTTLLSEKDFEYAPFVIELWDGTEPNSPIQLRGRGAE